MYYTISVYIFNILYMSYSKSKFYHTLFNIF